MPKKAFTLLELLIIVSLIAIVAIAVLILLNPWRQIAKAQDGRRKNDLAALQKALEDYYNDRGCYPTPAQICYNSPTSLPNGTYTCNICGNESTSPSFSPYLSRLPCDPQHPTNKLLYQVNSLTCPSWYRIYSELSAVWSRESDSAGCGEGGCGPKPSYGYDYGASSPNISLEKTPNFFCYTNTNTCDNCGGGGGDYNYCYINPTCLQVYATEALCCARLPKPAGCL